MSDDLKSLISIPHYRGQEPLKLTTLLTGMTCRSTRNMLGARIAGGVAYYSRPGWRSTYLNWTRPALAGWAGICGWSYVLGFGRAYQSTVERNYSHFRIIYFTHQLFIGFMCPNFYWTAL